MDGLARRYLLVPGLRSSNIYVLDTQPDPRKPALVKTIDARGAVREGRLLPPAHPALRTRRGLPDLHRRRRGRRRRTGRDRAARPRDLRRPARLGDRPRAAALPLRRLVAPQPERADLQRVGQPLDDRERHRAGAAAGREVRPRHPLLGPRRGQARTARRPRRAAPDGAGGPPVARSRGDLGFRRRRDLHRGPVRLDLALVPRRRRVEGREGHHHPGRARRPGPAAARAEAVRRGAAAHHATSTSRSTTGSSTSPAGAPAR